MDNSNKYKYLIYLIMAGAILFYLPFISRQFMGDDWLWLLNAKMAASDPSIFLERPMYGYFRPLNMAIVFIFLKLFGPVPYAFSLVNILLHACNIWLLWLLLGRLGLSATARNLSAFIFSFYTLNAPAIEWISVGHDLWVTGLSFLFAILILRLIEKPKFSLFLLCWIIGLMALLIKESGFVTIGIYFILIILKGNSPFRREFALYSLIFIVTYLLYLYLYFITRTISDRELDLGIGTVVNTWYLLSYLITPISKRIAEGFPARYLWILQSIKIVITLAVPVVLAYVYMKAEIGLKFIILWSVMFISTIAITRWDVSPFSLYPERTAGRFMYSAVPGMAAALSWIIIRFLNKGILNNAYVKYMAIILYIAGNFLATHRISQLYFDQQRLSTYILESLDIINPTLARCDSLVVLTEDLGETPQIVRSGEHLKGMIYVIQNHKIEVAVHQRENITSRDLVEGKRKLVIGWDVQKQLFMLPTTIAECYQYNLATNLHDKRWATGIRQNALPIVR